MPYLDSGTTEFSTKKAAMSNHVLQVEGLEKSFGSLIVTDNVNIRLPIGCRHGLIGPNGAGKTTLFNLIAGDITPDAGHVLSLIHI